MNRRESETEEEFKKRKSEYNHAYGIANREKILKHKKYINSTPEGKIKNALKNAKYNASEIGRSKRKLSSHLYHLKNKEKILIRHKINSMNPKRKIDMMANSLKHHYGITLQEYELMLVNQDGKCACCGKTPQLQGHRLSVDHHHSTGKVRGLLCRNCNVSLGLIKENKSTLFNMIEYLKKYNMEGK